MSGKASQRTLCAVGGNLLADKGHVVSRGPGCVTAEVVKGWGFQGLGRAAGPLDCGLGGCSVMAGGAEPGQIGRVRPQRDSLPRAGVWVFPPGGGTHWGF